MKLIKKVVQPGNSLSVNIPMNWAKDMGLKKGTKIELDYDDKKKTLTIKKKGK